MHGVLKVRTTEEQRLIRQKEQQKKLAAYKASVTSILSTRRKDSYDPDSLTLCAQILVSNPDVYTLWNFRKEAILVEIKNNSDDNDKTQLIDFLENELKLTEQCLLANPKSYGAFHHRFWVLDHHPKPQWQKELDLCTKYLQKDDRNFHVWDYRRLIVNKIGTTLTNELKFSTERINEDFSNYSSWHYRSTLRKLDESNIDSEINLVQNAVFTDPGDSSAWFYLRWVLSHSDVISKERKEGLVAAFDQLLELEPECRWVWLAKCWLMEGLDADLPGTRLECYEKLTELDPLRKGYYYDCIEKCS